MVCQSFGGNLHCPSLSAPSPQVHEGEQREQRVGPSQRTTSTSVGGTQMLVVRIHPRNSHV